MVNIRVEKQKLIDFSFMPSLKCNLSCPHCMYKASQKNYSVLDINKTKKFVSTIDFNKINAMGFYGGEISYDYENYQKIINLIQKKITKFTITNGTWSLNQNKSEKFLNFVEKNKLQVFISTTKFHKPFQNNKLLEKLVRERGFILKGEDTIIPMGRAYRKNWCCTVKCLNYNNPMRLTLNPSGKIMFCSCNGIYPIIGSYENHFKEVVQNAVNIKDFCEKLKTKN